MIDAGIYALLSADSAVSALVGNRIYETVAPDDLTEYPCVSYSFVGGGNEQTLSTTGVFRQRVQFDCFSVDAPETAKAIAAAVMMAVINWDGVLANGVNVLNTNLINPGTDFATEQRMFRRMIEFYVIYTLPVS